jgi:hypothetical protein
MDISFLKQLIIKRQTEQSTVGGKQKSKSRKQNSGYGSGITIRGKKRKTFRKKSKK